MESQKIQQCYYTHWQSALQKMNGWRVKAQSSGLTEESIKRVQPHFHYTVANPQSDIKTHPVALRYIPINSQESLLLCIHSIGRTEDERNGNHFVHALFLPSTAFLPSVPPIFYWDSSFWVKQDEKSEFYILPEISSLEDSPIEPGLIRPHIWEFLDTVDPEREKLKKLLSAVIHKQATSRPIIILDQPPQVAKWIAAINLLLPHEHRRLLSFSTYQNRGQASNNLQSNFFIIGLANPPERSIHAQDYQTYMIFDPHSRTSDVEPSDYAEQAITFAREKEYHNISSFFEKAMPKRRLPEYVGEGLEVGLKYEKTLMQSQPQSTDLYILRDRLKQWEAGPANSVDLNQLEQLMNYYYNLLVAGKLVDNVADLWRVLKLYPKINARPSRTVLGVLLKDAMKSEPSQVSQTIKQALDLYYPWELTHTFKKFDLINQQTVTILTNTSIFLLQDYWRKFALDLDPQASGSDTTIDAFLVLSLAIAYSEKDQPGRTEISSFKENMLHIMRERGLDWLRLALQTNKFLPGTIRCYYFDLIHLLPHAYEGLKQRIPYRDLLLSFNKSEFATIWQEEIENDIKKTGSNSLLLRNLIVAWMNYARNYQKEEIRVFLLDKVKRGLDLEGEFKRVRGFKQKILEDPFFAEALTPDAEKKSVVQTFRGRLRSTGQLHHDRQTEEMQETISEREFTKALAENQLTNEHCQKMQAMISTLDNGQIYQRKVASCLEGAFKLTSFIRIQHALLVRAIFVQRYQVLFMDEYLKHLKDLLLNPEKIHIIPEVFSFWYNDAEEDWKKYVRDEFIAKFPDFLSTIKDSKKFKDIVKKLHPDIQNQSWYKHSVFQQYFNPLPDTLLPKRKVAGFLKGPSDAFFKWKIDEDS